MALDQQYRKMLRDLMLQSDALAGQQTLPDGSIIGYGANNPDAMVSAVAPTPPMPDVQQVNQQPQTPQQLSALLVNQRPQGFNDQQRFDEAYQFKQAMPEKQSYLRNNTTGAVQMLPTGQSQVAAAPKNDFNDIIRFGNANGLDPQTIGKLVQYQGTVQAGMPSAKDLYAASFKYNRPIDEMLSMYGASAQAQRGQLQAEKERLGIDKARAEIAQLGAKPIDPEVSKQASLMRMYQSIPEGPMKQAFGEKHGFATKPLTPNEKDPSVSEQTAAYHVGKMLTSLKNIQDLSKDDPSLLAPGAAEAAAVSMPFGDAYSGTANMARSANRQAIFAKQTDMLDALLYLATGAAYNKEQLEQKRNSLLPSFTDKPEAVAQKQLELQDYMNRAKIRAGKAWTPEMEGLLKTTMGVGGGKSMADQIPKEAPPKITGQQPSAQRYRLKSPELNPKLKSSYEAY